MSRNINFKDRKDLDRKLAKEKEDAARKKRAEEEAAQRKKEKEDAQKRKKANEEAEQRRKAEQERRDRAYAEAWRVEQESHRRREAAKKAKAGKPCNGKCPRHCGRYCKYQK